MIITKNRTHSTASPHGSDELYGHISDVRSEYMQFDVEKSNFDHKTWWEEEDNINNLYLDCLEEDDSTLFFHCSDHDIKPKTGKINEKYLPPNFRYNERVINTNQETHIVDEKKKRTLI